MDSELLRRQAEKAADERHALLVERDALRKLVYDLLDVRTAWDNVDLRPVLKYAQRLKAIWSRRD